MTLMKGVSKGVHQKGEREVTVEILEKVQPNFTQDRFTTFKYFGMTYHCKFQAPTQNSGTTPIQSGPPPQPGTVPPTGEPPKSPEQPNKHNPETPKNAPVPTPSTAPTPAPKPTEQSHQEERSKPLASQAESKAAAEGQKRMEEPGAGGPPAGSVRNPSPRAATTGVASAIVTDSASELLDYGDSTVTCMLRLVEPLNDYMPEGTQLTFVPHES